MSTGEVARRLTELAGSVDRLQATLQPVITRDAADLERFRNIERAIKALQDWQTWATRLFIGGVVTGLLSLVYTL